MLAIVAGLSLMPPQARCDYQEGIILEFDTSQGLTTGSYDAGWKRAFPEDGATWKDAVVTRKRGARIQATAHIPFAGTYEVNAHVAQQGSQERVRVGVATYIVLAGGTYEGPNAPREWIYLPLGVQDLDAGPVPVELEHVGRAPDAGGAGEPLAFLDYLHLRPVSAALGKVVIAGVSVTDHTGATPALPLSGDLLTISALIRNNCAAVLPQSHLKCSVGGEEIGRTWIDVVQPGAETEAQIQWRARKGKHALALAVEPAAAVEGIDASAAKASVTVAVAAAGRPQLLAQLAVLEAESEKAVTRVTVGDALLIRVSVENVGDVVADSVRATVRANREPLPPALLPLGSVEPGESVADALEWSPEAGNYTLEVELVAENFDSRLGEPLAQATVTVVARRFPWQIAVGAAIALSAIGLLVLAGVRARGKLAEQQLAPGETELSRADREAGRAKFCPRCKRAYPAHVNYCPDDGARLQ